MVKLLITVGNADVNALDMENRSPLHSCGEFQISKFHTPAKLSFNLFFTLNISFQLPHTKSHNSMAR